MFLAETFQSRVAPFVGSILGIMLMALYFVQRRSDQEREAALRAVSIAAASARVKSDFLTKVSHELRTPLQNILGYGELLRTDISGQNERTRFAALRQTGDFMLRLVNDLLNLGAIEAGGFRLVEKPTPLHALVRDTIESLRPRAEAKGLTLTTEIAPDVPPWVRLDGERLRQILLNLAGNAVKFTDRGSVRVSLRSLSVDASEHHTLELAVRDTGPGIAPTDQARLFQPFSRLDFTAQKEGTGLGLALAAALCRAMGGKLALESDGHSGTCFATQLRLAAASAPESQLSAALRFSTLRGRRIFIVDDNTLVRDLFAAWLTDLGAVCEVARDGEQALAHASGRMFDAVILDLAMPKLDGLGVARQWRAAGRTWRIVGVSAHASGDEQAQAGAAGMDAFLTKPVELAALAEALTQEMPAPLDPSRHERLRAELAARFRELVHDDVARLRTALVNLDWPTLHRRAHHLKNSAAVVGDEHLYAACGQLEDAAETSDATAAAAAWITCEGALAPWRNS
jgi:two-component system sensor histidine kinase EvgS